MNAFEVYVEYLALKRHFSSKNYDYFKYRGKTNATVDSFEKRNDRFSFAKLAKKNDPKGWLLANISMDHNMWIGEIVGARGKTNYDEYVKTSQSLQRTYELDLKQLGDDLNKSIIVVDGQFPPLLKSYVRGVIHPQTMIILDRLCNIFSYWDKKIEDDILWPDVKFKLLKFSPFVDVDLDKYKAVTVKHFDNT